MSRTRLLLTHGWRVWRGGQTRFRLETFGAYFPHLPYRRRLWQLSPVGAALLSRRLAAYGAWLEEMEAIRQGGAARWWRDLGHDRGEKLSEDGAS